MEQTKAEILSELYAIRATMSIVAQNEGKTRKANKKIVENREGRKNVAQNIQAAQSKADSGAEALQCDVVMAMSKTKMEEKKLEIKNTLESPVKTFFISIAGFLGILMVLSFISAYFIKAWFEQWLYLEDGSLNMTHIIIYGAVLVLIGLLIAGAYFFILCDFKERNAMKSEIKIVRETYRDAQAKRQNGETYVDVEKVQSLYLDLEEYRLEQKQIDKRLEQEISQHQQTIADLKEDSRALVDSAIEAYPVIDFRDWGNVDLLIYYFETGRADGVKEALQLVDRQLQTDQITRAIEVASRELQNTIRDSVYRLGKTMVECFDRLSQQLEVQHREAELSRTMATALLAQVATKSTDLYVQVNAQLS